jgi:PEP-CTERM motif
VNVETLGENRPRKCTMVRRFGMPIFAAVLSVFVLLPLRCAAESVIFDSFNGNSAYGTPTPGWCVSGGTTSDCGPETTRWIAEPFTPGGNFTLTRIELDLGYFTGTNAATVNLVNDSGGLPGSSVLESWNLTSLAAWNTANQPSSVLVILPATGALTLDNGVQYWVEVTAGGALSTSLDIWATSSLNMNGTVLSLDGGSTWVNPLNAEPGSTGALTAVEVLGTPVPEPSSLVLALLAFGIAAKGRARNRGRISEHSTTQRW